MEVCKQVLVRVCRVVTHKFIGILNDGVGKKDIPHSHPITSRVLWWCVTTTNAKTLYYVKINRKCKKIDLLLFFHLPSMINPLERFAVFTENRRVIHPSLSV